MLAEVIDCFRGVPNGTFVDATVGGGGHAVAVLEAHPGLDLIGLDRDRDALAAAAERLARFGDRVMLRQARFDALADVVRDVYEARVTEVETPGAVTGVLFDLGVSSPQLDRPERGFSYRQDGPLDMRMDQDQELTAAHVVNTYSSEELARVLAEHGDERYARRIAAAIVRARPLSSTLELADVIRSAVPAPARRVGHPARRTFQALRIEVNREIEVLATALDAAVDLLLPGGRLAVLAYHSGEDRLVKQRFRRAVRGGCTCPPGLPCVCGAQPEGRLVSRGALRPSAAEIAANPRAEAARMRILEAVGRSE